MRNFHFQSALLPEGWANDVTIAVDAQNLIADIAVGVPCPPFTDRLPGVAIPGIPNLHSHAHQRALAGLTERSGSPGHDSFWTWRDAMYRTTQAIDPDDLQAIATQAFIEMLQAGYTHVTEFHYLHHAPGGRPYDNPAELATRIAVAATAAGIGLTLLPVLYMASGFDGAACTPGQARFACTIDQFAAIHAAIRVPLAPCTGVAPHSLRAVSPDAFAAVLAMAPGGPVHLHIAEQTLEVEACLAARGQRPVAWLLDHAPVDASWCLVHATHIDPAERQAIARAGALVALCPTTEANLGDGIFPAAAFQAEGGRFAVGSDSQVSASPFAELRLLEYTQRLATGRRTVLAGAPGTSTARTLLATACAAAAAPAGLTPGAPPAGQIEIGHRADIIVLAAHPGLAEDNALDAAMFAARGNPVRHVVVAGECIIRDGAHRLQAIAAARFGKVLDKLAAA